MNQSITIKSEKNEEKLPPGNGPSNERLPTK